MGTLIYELTKRINKIWFNIRTHHVSNYNPSVIAYKMYDHITVVQLNDGLI